MLYKIPVFNDVQYSCMKCCTLVCFALICCIKVWLYISLVGVLYLILLYTRIATQRERASVGRECIIRLSLAKRPPSSFSCRGDGGRSASLPVSSSSLSNPFLLSINSILRLDGRTAQRDFLSGNAAYHRGRRTADAWECVSNGRGWMTSPVRRP